MVDDSEEGGFDEEGNPFGWYSTIVYLAGENILNIDQVVSKHHLEVLNFMTYMSDLNTKRQREFEKQLKRW